MSVVLSILILALMLGVMVTVHEFGHFIAARAFGIRVREFAIGMGPAFYKRVKKDEQGNPLGTVFSLRCLPIGGFCDMGEDEDSDDPSHFRRKNLLKRCVVLAAGAAMNIVLALILVFIILCTGIGKYNSTNEITALHRDFPYAGQIQVGDEIIKVNGHAAHNYSELSFFLDYYKDQPLTLTLKRGSEKFTLHNVERAVIDEDGTARLGINGFGSERITAGYALRNTWYNTWFYTRIVQMSLWRIVTDIGSVKDMMGPVAMGSFINDTVKEAQSTGRSAGETALMLTNLAALISVNLAVFNLLPLPALDGGRILLAAISFALLKIRKRPLSANVEGTLHGAFFVLLLVLMVFVFFNDIRRLIGF